jgi:hypothetical protein
VYESTQISNSYQITTYYFNLAMFSLTVLKLISKELAVQLVVHVLVVCPLLLLLTRIDTCFVRVWFSYRDGNLSFSFMHLETHLHIVKPNKPIFGTSFPTNIRRVICVQIICRQFLEISCIRLS